MVLVTQQQLQRVLTGFKLQLDLRLAASEVTVIGVSRHRLVQVRQCVHVNQQVVMPCARFIGTRWRHAHTT